MTTPIEPASDEDITLLLKLLASDHEPWVSSRKTILSLIARIRAQTAPAEVVWTKKTKGNAKVYTTDRVDRAIVVNHFGISFDGREFQTLDEAKAEALSTPTQAEAKEAGIRECIEVASKLWSAPHTIQAALRALLTKGEAR